ncbi:MAG: beta-agarase [Planctomycetota bacterium]
MGVPDALPLFEFTDDFDLSRVTTHDATVRLGGNGRLLIDTADTSAGPGVTLQSPAGEAWDLDPYQHVKLHVANLGEHPAELIFKVGDPEDSMEAWQMELRIHLPAGEARTVAKDVVPTPWRFTEPVEFLAMRAAPGQARADLSRITQLRLTVNHPAHRHRLAIADIRATNPVQHRSAEGFFPFIDRFGQYKHDHWPGKTQSVDDLRQAAEEEQQYLAQHHGPKHFSRYGGWADGPQLAATGRFRAEKVGEAWWLVDPDGCLFWSHGACCVHAASANTGITDRENYLDWLPPEDAEFAEFYGTAGPAAHGHYKNLESYRTYNFTASNLYQKHGSDWQERFYGTTHARLRSWGMNTLAIASDPALCRQNRTPYTETVWVRGTRKLEASAGYWGKFHDVFDPGFRSAVRDALAKHNQAAADPWCIGFFIENELSWGADASLALATLAGPADQPAKRVFIETLREKYGDIAALNRQWGSDHASWDDLLQTTQLPDRARAWEDLMAFYTRTVETYFETVHGEMKAAAPDAMYLGCRLAWAISETVTRTAARHADVLSFNKYQPDVAEVGLPAGIDKPMVISEFHFGARDRGSLHVGIQAAAHQSERADKYRAYLDSALRNPYIVGTHWFQYGDQPPTGRGDGENYNVGLIDLADRPFPELTRAVTEVGHAMYTLRDTAAKEGGLHHPSPTPRLKHQTQDHEMVKRSN